MDAGELVQVAYLFTLLAFPVRAIGWVLGELPRSVVGWDRVSQRPGRDGRPDLRRPRTCPATAAAAALAVRDVSFGYDDEDVLHGVSFDVEAGRTVALVGPTGSGKSTLTTLLVRLVDPRTGAVELDGVDLRSVTRGRCRGGRGGRPAADVPVRRHGAGQRHPGARPRRRGGVVGAAGGAGRPVRGRACPAGWTPASGERGMSLSGGQRQRLALARAIVRGAAAARARRRDVLRGPAGGGGDPGRAAQRPDGGDPPTVVVVAYRKATIALADEVVYVEHGRVLDRGTHDELIGRCDGLPAAGHGVRTGGGAAPRGRGRGSHRRGDRGVAGHLTGQRSTAGNPSATAAASSR